MQPKIIQLQTKPPSALPFNDMQIGSQSLFAKSQSIIDMVEKSVEDELQEISSGIGFKSSHKSNENQPSNLSDSEMQEVARLKKLELNLHHLNLQKLQRLNEIQENLKLWKNVDI